MINGHHGGVPVVGVLETKGGRILAWREYYDRATLEKALAPKQEAESAY
ncbi:MAG: limonene-1,2-epoxide hydrolase family protein [Pseudomonadota bacterium]